MTLIVVVGLVVSGVMIAHDGVTAALRIGETLVVAFGIWLVYRLFARALAREQPRATQRPYIDVAVEKSYEAQAAKLRARLQESGDGSNRTMEKSR